MTSQINITLGVLRHIANDIAKKADYVNIAPIRVIRFNDNGTDKVQVFSTDSMLAEYDVKTIADAMPLQERYSDDQLKAENERLRTAMETIIQLKNDGAIAFVDQKDFTDFLKSYQHSEPSHQYKND